MRRTIRGALAALAALALALVGLAAIPATPASASPCNMTVYHNPDAPAGVSNSQLKLITWQHHNGKVNRQGCFQFGINGAVTTPQYRFRVQVQDMVDTLDPGLGGGDGWNISDNEGCTVVQWKTPGPSSVWTEVARDCNSADWNTDIWWSPYLHRVLNGEPHLFQFRVRNETRDASPEHFSWWATHTALYGNWTTIPLVYPS